MPYLPHPGWHWSAHLLLLCALTLGFASATAESVIRCQDEQGRWIYTDDRRRCPEESPQSQPEIYPIKLQNLHSRYGRVVSEEYHNYAFRSYAPVSHATLNIVAEKKLTEESPEKLQRAIDQLEKAVAKALSALPSAIRGEFRQVRYFFFTGDESRTGGRMGGQWYFRKGNSTSERFDDSIVIRSVDDYLTLYDETQAAQTALHELSHAYYYYHRKHIYWNLKAAFDNARAQKLYRNVKMKNGFEIPQAYALTNPREYFAELAKIYHLNNYHYPFNREELKEYDPQGYQMIEKAFRYRR